VKNQWPSQGKKKKPFEGLPLPPIPSKIYH